MPRRGEDAGVCLPGPIRSRWVTDADNTDTSTGAPSKREFESEIYRWNPRLRVDRFDDFESEVDYTDAVVPFVVSTSSVAGDVGKALASVTTSQVSSAEYTVTRPGFLDTADFVGSVTLATSNSNYVTFAIVNKLKAGSGAIALLAATAPNTTQTTGGSAWTAFVPFGGTLSATGANLRVDEGDVLQATCTVTGTLANEVPMPFARLRVRHVPKDGLRPRMVKTAGNPGIQINPNTANGEIVAALGATNELQYVGIDYGDQMLIPATKKPIMTALVKVGTVTTAQDVIIGFGTAFNSTLASISKYARFRLNASLVLRTDTTDGTTTNNTTAVGRGGITLTANQWYLFTIDMRDLSKVKFFLDDQQLITYNLSAFAVTDLLQPMIGIRKASGTGTVGWNADYVRVSWSRI